MKFPTASPACQRCCSHGSRHLKPVLFYQIHMLTLGYLQTHCDFLFSSYLPWEIGKINSFEVYFPTLHTLPQSKTKHRISLPPTNYFVYGYPSSFCYRLLVIQICWINADESKKGKQWVKISSINSLIVYAIFS